MTFLKALLASLLLLSASTLPTVSAHGKPDTPHEAALRSLHQAKSVRSLEKCSHNLRRKRDMHERRLAKREALVTSFVEKRGIKRRDITPYNKRDFAGLVGDISCILTPETMIGPFYVDKMPIRKDNREGELGVELVLDIQFVDVKTCEVVPNLYADIWASNSTGYYSGYEIEGTTGETWLRGLQPTDEDGIVQLVTIFPGWYPGRTVHIHVVTHHNGTITNTPTGSFYTGGTRPHIGQIFFDQGLINSFGSIHPYLTNNVPLMLNENDGIFLQQNTGYNAIMKTELIGDTIGDGLLGFISIGVDLTFDSKDTWPPPGGLPTGSGSWTFTRPPSTTAVPTSTTVVPTTTTVPTSTTEVSTTKLSTTKVSTTKVSTTKVSTTKIKPTWPPKPTWWPWKPKGE